MMQDSNAFVLEAAQMFIRKSIIFGQALMWQHIQPLRQTMLPNLSCFTVNSDLSEPQTGLDAIYVVLSWLLLIFITTFLFSFTIWSLFCQLTLFKLLFASLDSIQDNFSLWLAETELIRTQIIFLQPAQLPATNNITSVTLNNNAARTHRPVMPCSTNVSIAAFESPASRKNSETSDVVISCSFLFTQVEAGSVLIDASSSPNLAAIAPS